MSCRCILVLLALMGLAGCQPEEEENFVGCTEPSENSPMPPNPGLVRTGQPAQVFALPIFFHLCSGGASPIPSSATAEIQGPGGGALASQVELGSLVQSTVIQFTPEQPGPHHVLVEFAQWGGIRQVDVHAVVDRSAEAPSELLPVACPSLQRTTAGAWVCGARVLRGNDIVAGFGSDRLAVAGEVIWVVGSASVSRYVDTGTALVQTGSASRPLGGTEFLLATPNELVVLFSNSLALYTFREGVVSSSGTTAWSRPLLPIMGEGPYGVLLRENDRLALVTRSSNGPLEVCPYQLVSGRFERMPGTCTQYLSEAVGFEPGVLWTKDVRTFNSEGVPSLLIRRRVWAGGQLQEQGLLSLGPNVRLVEQALLSPAVVPLVRNAPPDPSRPPSTNPPIAPLISMVTWSAQRQGLLLEHLDAELTEVFASPSLSWGLVSAGSTSKQTRVRSRPPTP